MGQIAHLRITVALGSQFRVTRVTLALMGAPQAEQINNHFILREEFLPHGVCPTRKPTFHQGKDTQPI